MAPTPEKPELLVIVGPTASGKSDLAMKIAKEFNGEIIAADSRTVYKSMNIGTAKPTAQDQKQVAHWGIDIVDPGQRYSAGQFKAYAKSKIEDIQSRGKLPILVGGTGLYIDSIIYNFKFPAIKESRREDLEKLSVEKLQGLIVKNSWAMPKNLKNKRHLILTVERNGTTGQRSKLVPGVLVIGILPPDELLRANISKRAKQIFEAGIIAETKNLLDQYGEQALISTGGIIYKIILRLLSGELTVQEAEQLYIQKDWQYARRQRTWLRGNTDIKWFNNSKSAHLHLKNCLNNSVI